MLTRLALASAAWPLATCSSLDVDRSNTGYLGPMVQLVAADREAHASDAAEIFALEPCDPTRLAKFGLRLAPMHPPAWADLVPGSGTLRRLFASPLPEHVRHVLFFSHRGGYSILPGNRDGAVTLASQLDQRAQREAVLVVGFDEDHEGILESAEVFERYAAVLGATYRSTPLFRSSATDSAPR